LAPYRQIFEVFLDIVNSCRPYLVTEKFLLLSDVSGECDNGKFGLYVKYRVV